MLQIILNDQVFSSHLSRKGERGDGESHSEGISPLENAIAIPVSDRAGLCQRVLNYLLLSLGLSRERYGEGGA